MEKVKVSKKVAETLNLVKEKIWTDGDHWKIVRDHVLTRANFCVEDLEPLNILSLDTLIRALYIGYEIEQTPEEQAIQWMIKRKCLAPGFSEHDIVMAIKSILNNPHAHR